MKNIQMWNGDCLQLMKKIDSKSVDLIVADPPYEIVNMQPYFLEMVRVLSNNGSIYVFGNKNMIAEKWFSQFPMKNKDLLIWHYLNSPKPKGRWRGSFQAIIYGYYKDSPFFQDDIREEYLDATKKLNGKKRPSLGRMSKPTCYNTSKGALPRDVIKVPALLGHLSKQRVGHDDQKPRDLIDKLIMASSKKGDLVLDCFAGSGTTGESCLFLGRKCILIEKNVKFFKIMQKRVNKAQILSGEQNEDK